MGVVVQRSLVGKSIVLQLVKLWLGRLESPTDVLSSSPGCYSSSLLLTGLGKQQRIPEFIGSLPLTWEIQIEFLDS